MKSSQSTQPSSSNSNAPRDALAKPGRFELIGGLAVIAIIGSVLLVRGEPDRAMAESNRVNVDSIASEEGGEVEVGRVDGRESQEE